MFNFKNTQTNRRTSKTASGMTLIEVVVTLAIFVTVMIAVTAFEANVFSYSSSISSSYTTVQAAETILKTIAKEVRMTSPGSDGSYAIQTAATNTLMFYADTNGTGIKTRIKYYLSGTRLYRAALIPTGSPLAYTGIESTTTIMSDVRNATSTPLFEYFDGSYDGNNQALAQPVSNSSVRLIKVNVTLDTDPNRSPTPRTYTTQVTLRNLKDNQ